MARRNLYPKTVGFRISGEDRAHVQDGRRHTGNVREMCGDTPGTPADTRETP